MCHKPGVHKNYNAGRWRPFNRRAFRTLRPPLVFIRSRNPCTRFRWRTLGCHVRFGIPVPHSSDSQHMIIPFFSCPCKSVALVHLIRQFVKYRLAQPFVCTKGWAMPIAATTFKRQVRPARPRFRRQVPQVQPAPASAVLLAICARE
jgi:hypothetical protein